MKAVLLRKYGGPEEWTYGDAATPKPGPGEVLVRVRAASINPIDWKIRDGMVKWIYPLKMPAILGRDLAGEVVSVGKGCDRLRAGDRVFGQARKTSGSFAEYALASEDNLALAPEKLSFEQAASIPLAALTALQSLRDLGRLASGQELMVIGASGGVGIFAIQLGKLLGARVTAVCSERNKELVKSLGADSVVDYHSQEPSQVDAEFDVIFDASGLYPFSKFRARLRPRGRFVSTLPSLSGVFWSVASFLAPGKKMKLVSTKGRFEDLDYLRACLDEGAIRPVIDRTFALSELREASVYSENGHARGKIVIAVG